MNNTIFRYAGMLLIGLVAGSLLFGGSGTGDSHEGHAHAMAETGDGSAEETVWTCSMHPQIRQSAPGKCPLCAMDLIPAASGSGSEDRYTLTMTPEAIRLAEIRTAPVTAGVAHRLIRMPGEVRVSEAGLRSITAQFSGRVVSQRVEFTGQRVRRGEELFQVWSPEIITAQRELIDALGGSVGTDGNGASHGSHVSDGSVGALGTSGHVEQRGPGGSGIDDVNGVLAEAARNKLRFWQLTEDQIAGIERDRVVRQHIPIYAPAGGFVTSRNVRVDDVIEPGMVLYEIADLSKVWIEFDVYERDLGAVGVGARVRFEAGGLVGERMSGVVSWVDPIVDRERRTARVRVEADNRDGSWRPGMIVHGLLEAPVSAGSMLIPNSAVLWTGRRSLVYVASVEDDVWTFESREVVLGDRAGDMRVILEGLTEGDRVVVNGAFKVDAEFQLRDKFSMMNRDSGGSVNGSGSGASSGHHTGPDMQRGRGMSGLGVDSRSNTLTNRVSGIRRDVTGLTSLQDGVTREFLVSLEGVLDGYFEVREALFASNGSQAARGVNGLRQRLGSLDGRGLGGQTQSIWMGYQLDLLELLSNWPDESQLEPQRMTFYELSELLNEIVTRYGVQHVVYQQFCPMAFNDTGATWLSRSDRIENPYLPETMAGCGEVLVKIGG